MPTFLFTSPEGTKYKVTGPEGATAEQAFALIQPQTPQAAVASEAPYNPAAEMTTGQRFAAGAGKAVSDIGRGAQQVDARLRSALGIDSGEADAERLLREETLARERDAALMETTAGRVGNIAGNVAAAVPASLIPGAATLPGAALTGATFGAAQPVVEGESRLANTATGAVLAPLGQAVGSKIAGAATRKIAQRSAAAEATKAANVGRDAILKQSRQAGYVVPPASVNPSAGVTFAESLSGKAATAQTGAFRNQAVTERLVRAEIGLPDNATLNKATLDAVRWRARRVYGEVAKSGRVTTSDAFRKRIGKLTAESTEIAKEFPDLNVAAASEIGQLSKALNRDTFSSGVGLQLLSQLRKQAAGHFKQAADPSMRALAHAERESADAIEEEILRHVTQSGNKALADSFDGARKLIAQTYTLQNALKGSRVSAQQLGKQLEKGAPLSGNLKLIAQFAQEFPEAARITKGSPGVSNVDAMVAAIGTSLTGNPAALAYPGGRWVARQLLLSQTGQKAFATPDYKPTTADLELLRSVSQRLALPGAVGASGVVNAEQ